MLGGHNIWLFCTGYNNFGSLVCNFYVNRLIFCIVFCNSYRMCICHISRGLRSLLVPTVLRRLFWSRLLYKMCSDLRAVCVELSVGMLYEVHRLVCIFCWCRRLFLPGMFCCTLQTVIVELVWSLGFATLVFCTGHLMMICFLGTCRFVVLSLGSDLCFGIGAGMCVVSCFCNMNC